MSDTRQSIATDLSAAVSRGVAIVVALFGLAFLLMPSARDRLIVEDGIIETATAIVFLAAAIGGMIAIRSGSVPGAYWLIPAFGLFGFLDEMSFGARVFGFPLPTVNGLKVDSFHDIFDLADRLAGTLGVSRTQIAGLAVLLTLAALAYLLRTGRLRRVPAWLHKHRAVMTALAALGLLLIAVALDLLGSSPSARFAEETAEFAAAGLLLVAAAQIHASGRTGEAGNSFELQQSGGAS